MHQYIAFSPPACERSSIASSPMNTYCRGEFKPSCLVIIVFCSLLPFKTLFICSLDRLAQAWSLKNFFSSKGISDLLLIFQTEHLIFKSMDCTFLLYLLPIKSSILLWISAIQSMDLHGATPSGPPCLQAGAVHHRASWATWAHAPATISVQQ